MSYRVETASSNRATCKATECSNNGIKIDKDDLRFGVWVNFEDRGSWAWRHWGCVSGKQLQNLRQYLEDPKKPGTYRYDFLDGYDGQEKNSLDKVPDLQDKVRRVIEQGFIDPEDWNGDPEMNKLGETGLFTKEHKKIMMAEKRQAKHALAEKDEEIAKLKAEIAELQADGKSTKKKEADLEKLQGELDDEKAAPAKSTTPKKRVRAEGVEEAEATKPAKKKRATKKAKKELDEEEEEVKPKPAKKGRAKKAKKEESEDEEEDIDMKLEDDTDGDEQEDIKPAKKGRGKKAVKKEEDPSDEDEEVMPAPSRRAKVKKENGVKAEQDDRVTLPEPSSKKKRGGKNVKQEQDEEDTKPPVKTESARKGRGSKTASTKAEPQSDDEVDTKLEDIDVKGEPAGDEVDSVDNKKGIKDEDDDAKDAALKEEPVKNESASENEVEKKAVKKAAAKKGKGASTTAKARGRRRSSAK